jgi:hypothetical protein
MTVDSSREVRALRTWNAADALAVYRSEASSCTRCHDLGLLHRDPDGQPAPPLFHLKATGRSGVLFVFEAPNRTDTYDKGKMTCGPDSDKTGQLIFELLRHVGLWPEDVVPTNAVLCLPAEHKGRYPVRAQQRKVFAFVGVVCARCTIGNAFIRGLVGS